MRRLVSILMLNVLLVGALFAQQKSDEKSKKELRQERKEQRLEELQITQDTIRRALEERDFTLRVNTIRGRTGLVVPVDNLVNILQISGDDIAIQFGNLSLVGYNGVGGITYDGKIQDFEFIESNGRSGFSVNIIFNSPGTIHAASVRLDVSGDNVTARFTDGSRRATMSGFFERNSESLTFITPNISNRIFFW